MTLKFSLLIISILNILTINIHTWCGCDVPGMILLHDLEGAVEFDRSNDMSVHV